MKKIDSELEKDLEQNIVKSIKSFRINVPLIRSFGPCYDPVTGLNEYGHKVNEGFLQEEYNANLLEFLQHPKVPAVDKVWLMNQSTIGLSIALNSYVLWGLEIKGYLGMEVLSKKEATELYVRSLVSAWSKLLNKYNA